MADRNPKRAEPPNTEVVCDFLDLCSHALEALESPGRGSWYQEYPPASNLDEAYIGYSGGEIKDLNVNSLSDITPVGNSVRARTELAFNSNGPEAHVHGSMTMLSVVPLAEKLLSFRESITQIPFFRWRQVIFNNLDLIASLSPISDEKKSSPLVLNGILTSSNGRSIYIKGYDSETPVSIICPSSNIWEKSFSQVNYISCNNSDKYNILIDCNKDIYIKLMKSETGVNAASWLDLSRRICAQLAYEIGDELFLQAALLTGIRDFNIPNPRLLPDAPIEISVFINSSNRSVTNKGLTKVSTELTFNTLDNKPLGGVTMDWACIAISDRTEALQKTQILLKRPN